MDIDHDQGEDLVEEEPESDLLLHLEIEIQAMIDRLQDKTLKDSGSPARKGCPQYKGV